jgi:hypothetical protein
VLDIDIQGSSMDKGPQRTTGNKKTIIIVILVVFIVFSSSIFFIASIRTPLKPLKLNLQNDIDENILVHIYADGTLILTIGVGGKSFESTEIKDIEDASISANFQILNGKISDTLSIPGEWVGDHSSLLLQFHETESIHYNILV